MGGVSLWIKGKARVAINDFLILGPHKNAPSLACENDCISGSHAEILFYWELSESFSGTPSPCIPFYLG